MKNSKILFLACLTALVAALAAQAGSFDTAVTALKKAPVYVEAGTPGTDSDTSGQLSAQLSGGDNIAIAMLPKSALTEGDGSASEFAKKLDVSLGGNRIIGLAIDDQVVAYSDLLPDGTASQLMTSAKNVSTTNVETLLTFINNVHDWQSQNPKAPASKPAAHKKKGGGFSIVALIPAIVVFFVVLTLLETRRRRKRPTVYGVEHLKFHSPVQDKLETIAHLRGSITDPDLRDLVTQVCTDVDAYFNNFCTDPKTDAQVFQDHLTNVEEILRKYIKMQGQPDRYYKDRRGAMQSGVEALQGFSSFVQNSIQNGSQASLSNYRVNTQILSAKLAS